MDTFDDFPPLTELRRETREDYGIVDCSQTSQEPYTVRLEWAASPTPYTGEQVLPDVLPVDVLPSTCYPVKPGVDEKKIISDLENGFASANLNFLRNGDSYIWEVSTKPLWYQMQRIIEVRVFRVPCETGKDSLTVHFLNFAGAHGFDKAGTYIMIDAIAKAADLDMTISINPWANENEIWSVFE